MHPHYLCLELGPCSGLYSSQFIHSGEYFRALYECRLLQIHRIHVYRHYVKMLYLIISECFFITPQLWTRSNWGSIWVFHIRLWECVELITHNTVCNMLASLSHLFPLFLISDFSTTVLMKLVKCKFTHRYKLWNLLNLFGKITQVTVTK